MATTGSKSLGQAGVVIEAPGAAQLARRLQRWGTAIEDARPAFEEILPMLNKGEAAVFDSSGAAIGERWPAAAQPERKTDSHLLVATGELRRSLAAMTSDSVRLVTPTELRFSTRVPYAHLHERGVPGRLPARPFMGIPDAVSRDVVNAMHRLSVAVSEASAGGGL
jgi:phage gpG-like protein